MVVHDVREYREERQSVSEARHLLKAVKDKLGKDKATRRHLYQLFPYGYGQQACKITGTPKPPKLMLDV
jgi:tRNA 2-thiouridine synthesizing protein E